MGYSDGKKSADVLWWVFFGGVSPEKGGLGSSYAEVVCGAITSSGKISVASRPMAEVRELDLMPMSLFRDKEVLREAVNCSDLEEKPPVLMEKRSRNRCLEGGSKGRKMRSLRFPRFWKNLLDFLRPWPKSLGWD